MRSVGPFLLLLATGLQARAIHFDADSGNDAGSGATPMLARKSFGDWRWARLGPGDSLLFKRGSRWVSDSLILSGEGTSAQPIVLTSYGDPAKPRPRLENTGLLVILHDMRHVVVEDLELSGARDACLQLSDSSVHHALVRGLETAGCGSGIRASGSDVAIVSNQLHDGRMVVNTQDVMDDDYGATGIVLERLDGCVVRANRMWNLSAPSWDYGADGGAVEFWKTVRRCEITGNFAYASDGFAEFGGQPGDSAIDIALHHNVALECGRFACFHIQDPEKPFGVGYDSVRVDNNLSVTRGGSAWSHHVVADGGLLERRGRIRVRNNVFVTDSSNVYVWQEGQERDPTWVREANLVWNPIHDPFASDRIRGEGEIWADPRFADAAWNATARVDTVIAHFALRPESPGFATGIDLGYAVDFFGDSATPGGVVDRGPFAHRAVERATRRPRPRGGSIVRHGDLVIVEPPLDAVRIRLGISDAWGRKLGESVHRCDGESERIAMRIPSAGTGPLVIVVAIHDGDHAVRTVARVLPPW